MHNAGNRKVKMKTHYIPNRSYGQETTIVFNPVKSKSKPKKRPQLSSSLIMVISFISILIVSFNAFAKPISYQCKDTEVVGLTGMMDGDVEGTFYQKQVFHIILQAVSIFPIYEDELNYQPPL